MIGTDLTIPLLAMRLLAGVVIAIVQGLSIAGVAVLLGDRGPRFDGRLSVLPPAHVDLVGLGSMALTGFGWGRPVAIEAGQLRIGRWGLAVAVLAGSLALLILAALLVLVSNPLLVALPYTAGLTVTAFVRLTARLCVWTALLALLPIPPLAGAHFLAALGIAVPRQAVTWLGWALLVASLLGVTRMVLTPAYAVLAPLVLGADIAR